MGGSPLGDAAVSASWNGPKAITCSTCERKIKRLFLEWVRSGGNGVVTRRRVHKFGSYELDWLITNQQGCAGSKPVASTQGTAVLPFFSLLGATNLTHEASRVSSTFFFGDSSVLLLFFPFCLPFPCKLPVDRFGTSDYKGFRFVNVGVEPPSVKAHLSIGSSVVVLGPSDGMAS